MKFAQFIVATISAQHPNAVDFNDQLRKLQLRREVIIHEIKREGEFEQRKLSVVFDYKVVSCTDEPFVPMEARGADCIRVIRRWINRGQFEYMATFYGLPVPNIPAVAVSPIYYRVNGVLVVAGQGKQILNPHQRVLSDCEWDSIKRGVIHHRLLAAA